MPALAMSGAIGRPTTSRTISSATPTIDPGRDAAQHRRHRLGPLLAPLGRAAALAEQLAARGRLAQHARDGALGGAGARSAVDHAVQQEPDDERQRAGSRRSAAGFASSQSDDSASHCCWSVS